MAQHARLLANTLPAQSVKRLLVVVVAAVVIVVVVAVSPLSAYEILSAAARKMAPKDNTYNDASLLLSCFFLFLHLASSFALWNLLSLLAWPMHLPRCTHGQCTWPHVAARIIKSICCQLRHCDLLCFYTRYTRESRVFELMENVHKRKKEAWQTPTKYS